MNVNAAESGSWIKALGDVFLGLNSSAVIRRVIGHVDIVPGLAIKHIVGLTWQEFVEQYADETARKGLRYAWLAMAEARVASAHWPSYLPFKPGMVARLRPVQDDPIVSFAIHIATRIEQEFNTVIGEHALDTVDRLTRLIRRLDSGVTGPLTDPQVKDVESILALAETAQQLLEDLCAATLVPAAVAPLPQTLDRLLTFAPNDFASRRMETQRLSLSYQYPKKIVYCQPTLRERVKQTLHTLLGSISPQTTITIAQADPIDEHTVRIEIRYHSLSPELLVNERIDPKPLVTAERLQTQRVIERLVNATQAHLNPVSGQVWAEPCQSATSTACIVLILPIWKEAAN
jgi:hypothetical protein